MKPLDTFQGHSFAAALECKEVPEYWRKATYYRYWMHMAHGHNKPPHFGMRTKKYKLIFFYGVDYTDIHAGQKVTGKDGNRFWKSTPAGWEFYDLEKDPHEMDNRYGEKAYGKIIAELKAELKCIPARIGDMDKGNPRIRAIIDAHWND